MSCAKALAFFSATLAGAELNVYDKPMQNCGATHSDGCTYAAFDFGAHEVCVSALPHGFSSETGQGPWSDVFEGQPWCICIWAYSNYILQHHDLSLKCESIPSKVLEEQYSLDKFEMCGKMSSSEGCGPEDIGRSIHSLCHQCKEQANGDEAAENALKSKCDRILAAAPHAPTQLLGNNATVIHSDSVLDTQAKHSLLVFAAIGFVVSVTVAAISAPRLRNKLRGNTGMQPLLIS